MFIKRGHTVYFTGCRKVGSATRPAPLFVTQETADNPHAHCRDAGVVTVPLLRDLRTEVGRIEKVGVCRCRDPKLRGPESRHSKSHACATSRPKGQYTHMHMLVYNL